MYKRQGAGAAPNAGFAAAPKPKPVAAGDAAPKLGAAAVAPNIDQSRAARRGARQQREAQLRRALLDEP